jgi:hypothetical protein
MSYEEFGGHVHGCECQRCLTAALEAVPARCKHCHDLVRWGADVNGAPALERAEGAPGDVYCKPSVLARRGGLHEVDLSRPVRLPARMDPDFDPTGMKCRADPYGHHFVAPPVDSSPTVRDTLEVCRRCGTWREKEGGTYSYGHSPDEPLVKTAAEVQDELERAVQAERLRAAFERKASEAKLAKRALPKVAGTGSRSAPVRQLTEAEALYEDVTGLSAPQTHEQWVAEYERSGSAHALEQVRETTTLDTPEPIFTAWEQDKPDEVAKPAVRERATEVRRVVPFMPAWLMAMVLFILGVSTPPHSTEGRILLGAACIIWLSMLMRLFRVNHPRKTGRGAIESKNTGARTDE